MNNIKKFNELNEGPNIKYFTKPTDIEKFGIKKLDLTGGIERIEYDEILRFVVNLKTKLDKGTLTDEEKIISEVLLKIVQHPFDRTLNFDLHYHRRLGFVKDNKDKKIQEGASRTYDEFSDELYDELIACNLNDRQAQEYMDYWHGKSYLYDMWQSGESPKSAIDQLKVNGEIKWYK